MNLKVILSVILIGVGIVAFGYQGITYTTREKAIDFGPLQVTAEKTHTIPLPPIAGAIALIGGIMLLMTTGRKTS